MIRRLFYARQFNWDLDGGKFEKCARRVLKKRKHIPLVEKSAAAEAFGVEANWTAEGAVVVPNTEGFGVTLADTETLAVALAKL